MLSRTGPACYAGCGEQILPPYAVGAAGCVGTVADVAPEPLRAVLDAFDAGDTAEAARRRRRLLPPTEAVTATSLPGTVTTKAPLTALGLPRPAPVGTTTRLLASYACLG